MSLTESKFHAQLIFKIFNQKSLPTGQFSCKLIIE